MESLFWESNWTAARGSFGHKGEPPIGENCEAPPSPTPPYLIPSKFFSDKEYSFII